MIDPPPLRMLLLLLLWAATLGAATLGPGGKGTGCMAKMKQYCPQWLHAPKETAACLACVESKLAKLAPNCTEGKADKLCRSGRPPAPPPPPPPPLPPVPPAPPLPPLKPTAGSPRPHILLFVIDDMGWANIGFRNKAHTHTPNLDLAASEGVVLDRHYTYRWCSPTRSALMTGRLPCVSRAVQSKG